MITEDEYKKAIQLINDYRDQIHAEIRQATIRVEQSKSDLRKVNNNDQLLLSVSSDTNINDLLCSRRLKNLLKRLPEVNGYTPFKVVSKFKKAEVASLTNFGNSSMTELEKLMVIAGIEFKHSWLQ
jgi:DNA integrity scanning protein DisA with diadenylate cyclase activity